MIQDLSTAMIAGIPVPQPPGNLGQMPPELNSLLNNPRVQNNPAISGALGALIEHHEAANSPAPLDPAGATEAARRVIRRGGRKAVAAGEETKAASEDALQAGLQAVDSQEAQDTAVAGAQAPVAREALAAENRAQKKFAEDRAKIEADITTAKNGYMAAVDNLKNTRVQSWWSGAGTGATILGIISQTLSGGLQGMGGGAGPTPLDRVIDQDMQRQHLEFEKRSKVTDASQNLYSQLMTQLKERTLTEEAFRQIAYHSTAERMKLIATTMGGRQAKANGDKWEAELMQKQVDSLSKANEHIATTHTQAGIAEGNVIMKGADLAGENARAGLAADVAAGKGKQGVGAAGIEHFDEYYKINPIAGEKLIEKMGYAQATKAALGNVEKMIGVKHTENGKTVFIPKEQKAIDALSKDQKMEIGQNMAHAVLNISKYADFGALSEGDKKLAESVTGATDDWMAYASAKLGITSYAAMYKRIETLKRNVDNDLKARVGILEVPGADGRKHKLKYNPEWQSGAE